MPTPSSDDNADGRARIWYEEPVSTHVLVAEDDPKQAELIRRYLERDGHEVAVVHDGQAALVQVYARRPDLVVLDVMMPQFDGLEVCRELGETGIPIVMLTARSTENDVLLGLSLGADDYITKPFSPRELVARIRTVLRRGGQRVDEGSGQSVSRCGELCLDAARHEVRLREELVECTPVEFDVLQTLIASPGRVFSRRQLLEQIHGATEHFTERSIDVHVMNLRKKIEADPREPQWLLTVYGVGYKLADPGSDAPPA